MNDKYGEKSTITVYRYRETETQLLKIILKPGGEGWAKMKHALFLSGGRKRQEESRN